MAKLARYTLLLLAILMLGTALRLVGLTRGYSQPPGQQPTFYSFHPDERTLLQAAGQLDRLTDPPLTAYGPVPMLLAKLWLNGTGLIVGYDALNTDTPAHQPTLFIAARLLAIVLALATLYGMYRLGSALFNPATAALATLWVAVVPLPIQQAHFYTIDGVFTLVVVLFFWILHSALTTHKRGFYLLCGLLIGVAGGVRFNGMLLGLILVAGHLACGPAASLWTRLSRQARQANLWWATGAALVVFFALQPYILLQPERLWQLKGTNDFLYSAQITNGTLLRPWSLVDLHTVPYLHYWTHLWPTGVGWPLTVGFGLGLSYATVSRRAVALAGIGLDRFVFLCPSVPYTPSMCATCCRCCPFVAY